MLLPVGLKAETSPDVVHHDVGKFGLGGHGTAVSISPVFGLGFDGLAEESSHLLIVDGMGTTRFGLIAQTGQTLVQLPPAPLPHRGQGKPQLGGNVRIVPTVGSQQNDAGPLRQGLG
jgi:hypothetical protein